MIDDLLEKEFFEFDECFNYLVLSECYLQISRRVKIIKTTSSFTLIDSPIFKTVFNIGVFTVISRFVMFRSCANVSM